MSKSIIFLVKSFLGNFYRHLEIFLVTLIVTLRVVIYNFRGFMRLTAAEDSTIERKCWFTRIENILSMLQKCNGQLCPCMVSANGPFEPNIRIEISNFSEISLHPRPPTHLIKFWQNFDGHQTFPNFSPLNTFAAEK